MEFLRKIVQPTSQGRSLYLLILWMAYIVTATDLDSPQITKTDSINTKIALTKTKSVLPELKSVKVRSQNSKLPTQRHQGATRLTRQSLKNMASSVGDPIRSAASLPGVTIQSDFNAQPTVRGGRPQETGVFLNGIRLQQPYHFGSVFSIVNQESIKDLSLYTSHFPSYISDVMSGAILLNTRPASLDSTQLTADVSLLKGNGYASFPVLKNQLSFNLGYHSLWYDHTAKALLNLFAGDSAYESEMREYRKYINLPNHRDIQYSANLKLGGNATVQYTGLSARDKYNVTIPREQNIFNPPKPRFFDPKDIAPIMEPKTLQQAQKIGLDSLSLVHLNNQVHIVNLHWQISPDFNLKLNGAAQWQTWDVAFSNAIQTEPSPNQKTEWYNGLSPSKFLLDRLEERYDFALSTRFTGFSNHLIDAGFDASYQYGKYYTSLPMPLYKMVTENNINVLESIGLYKSDGFSITRENPEINSTDILGELARRIRFDYQGWYERHNSAVYLADDFEISHTSNLQTAIRFNYQYQSNSIGLEPRVRYHKKLFKNWGMGIESGIFTNDLYPFYNQRETKTLVPERAFHGGFDITRRFKNFQLEVRPYGKYNDQLVTPHLSPTGELDLASLLIPHPDNKLTDQELLNLKVLLESKPNPEILTDSVRYLSETLYGDYSLRYNNKGYGYTVGSEFIISYAKGQRWTGWLSLDRSVAQRNDGDGTILYDAPFHRPWSFNWINTIHLPGLYLLSLKVRHAAGYAYTPYTGTLNDGGNNLAPVVVGKRNSARYAPYSRVDLRLVKTANIAGHKIRSYFEVWNVFNNPNYFMRDSKTRELKFPDLNLPFPFLFFGIEYQL